MYHRLGLTHFARSAYKFNAYRASSGIRFQINRFNNVASDNGNQQKVESCALTRFSGYKLIYVFPYIKYVSKLNIIKRGFTLFFGAAIPAIACLNLANIVPVDIGFIFLINGKIL